jgi:hypothetical protein
MDAPADVAQERLLADLDRLGERLDQTLALVQRLRAERDASREQWGGLLREAGVKDVEGLRGVVARWKALEQENRLLHREREGIGRRLGALLEKVDLLQGDS